MKQLITIIEKVKKIAKKKDKLSFFSIANTANINNPDIMFPAIRETEDVVCGNVLVRKIKDAENISKIVDGKVDFVLVDAETKVGGLENLEKIVRKNIKKSKVLSFKPNDLTIEAVDTLISQIKIKKNKIAIIGLGNIGSKIALKLVERGIYVTAIRPEKNVLKKIVDGINCIKPTNTKAKIKGTTNNLEASRNTDVMIGCTPGIAAITKEMVKSMKRDGAIIDVGNGTIFPDALEEAQKRGIKIFCPSMMPGFAGAVKTILETRRYFKEGYIGKNKVKGITIIAGIVGNYGDIVVDNVKNPNLIVGVANGKGDIITSEIKEWKIIKNLETIRRYVK